MVQTDFSTEDVQAVKDEEAFQKAVKPQLDALTEAAQQALTFYVEQQHIHADDLTPEEVVGETLIYAWQHRERRPAPMSLRGWLLGTQYRVLRGLVQDIETYREDKVLSLDEPIPNDPSSFRATDDTQEWFWEWYQPDAVLTWEDVTPKDEPVDIGVPLNEDLTLDRSEAYHVLMLHDEFEMPMPEVAFTMGRSINAMAELMDQARVTFRERLGNETGVVETDDPAPPFGSDQ
ncbi:MAG TPA: hypothetical protein VKP65_17255 [Rhodothermales bacterium]|nr:hypothetical protein [Rhodothermales bacterium]